MLGGGAMIAFWIISKTLDWRVRTPTSVSRGLIVKAVDDLVVDDLVVDEHREGREEYLIKYQGESPKLLQTLRNLRQFKEYETVNNKEKMGPAITSHLEKDPVHLRNV